MCSPSSARRGRRSSRSHRIAAPAITLTAPRHRLHVTARTKCSRCPLLDFGSPWHRRSPRTTPSPPSALVAAELSVQPGPPRGARRVTPRPPSPSREAHLRRRPRQAQLQRFGPQPQMTEHLADRERISNLRDHVPPSTAPWTAQDIYTEHSFEELRPQHARLARAVVRALLAGRIHSRRRRAQHDLIAKRRRRCERPVISQLMLAGVRHDRDQALKKVSAETEVP